MRHLSNSLTSPRRTHENFSLETFSPLFSRGGSWHIWQKLWTFSHYRQHDMCDIRHSLKMTTRAGEKPGKGRRRRTKMKISHQNWMKKPHRTQKIIKYISRVCDSIKRSDESELSWVFGWVFLFFLVFVAVFSSTHPDAVSRLYEHSKSMSVKHIERALAAAAAVQMSEWV